MMFLKLPSKRTINAFQFLYKQIVIQSCFFTPAIMMGRLGVIPSNTQGFPVLMKSVLKTVDFSFQESFSKQFIKYSSLFTSYPNTFLIHITREIFGIDHFHKWRPITNSFAIIKISLTNLLLKLIIQKSFYSETRLVRLI